MNSQDLLFFEAISKYYAQKINAFGPTPQGVDWKDESSQTLRFQQLLALIQPEQAFCLLELGCGYGKLVELLQEQFERFQYRGYDLAPEMIAQAQALYADEQRAQFFCLQPGQNLPKADYVVASGIFNVKMHFEAAEWQHYILDTLAQMHQASDKGFAFNLLTAYADAEYMRDDLYYGSPSFYFDYCMQHFSRRVDLKHDYPLYEFTLLVRKDV